jgi:hypothetical protein
MKSKQPQTTELEIFLCCPNAPADIGFCGVGITANEAQKDLKRILKANFRPEQSGIVFSNILKVKK